MPFTRPVKTLAIGGSHTLLITDQMQLFVMGDNSSGQLGLGSEKIKIAAYPTLVTSLAYLQVIGAAAGLSHSLVLT
jgi:alpha-tubulin suppressor-like RCC1 family protein